MDTIRRTHHPPHPRRPCSGPGGVGARRRGLHRLAWLPWLGLAGFSSACSESEAPLELLVPASIEVVSRMPQPGIAHEPIPDPLLIQVLDRAGRPVPGVTVRFEPVAGDGYFPIEPRRTDHTGTVRGEWILGEQEEQVGRAVVEGVPPALLRARAYRFDPETDQVLAGLPIQITAARERVAAVQVTPANAAQVAAKLDLLHRPGLAGDIIAERRFARTGLASNGGREVPVVAVYPEEGMRADVMQEIERAGLALAALEEFLGLPFAPRRIHMWYGFSVGSAGGGGGLYLEDRASYEARGNASMPYAALTFHELAHSWFGHESLTQFLELYAYNLALTGSADPGRWPVTRGYREEAETDRGVGALLSVYRLVGREAMAAGYRAVYPLRPPYGQELSREAQAAFTAAMPIEHRARVSELMARVGF